MRIIQIYPKRQTGAPWRLLQIDGYAAYNRLGKDRGTNDATNLAGCWAHSRRKFFDLHASDGSSFASAVVKAMAPLWAIEEDIRGHGAELRTSIRAERSRPIFTELFAMLDRSCRACRVNPNLPGPSAIP